MDQPAIIVTDEDAARIKARSAKIQQYLLYTRIGFRTLDLIAAIICATSLTDTLVEYYVTQRLCAPNNGPCAWFPPAQTKTYPSLVCLGAAYINLLLSGIVLMAYVWGPPKADQWEDTRGTFEKACTALKITLSSAAAGSMYGTSSSTGTSQSLWGQSCNNVTQSDQVLTLLVDFGDFCIQQELAIGMHLAHLVFEGLTGITYVLNYWADQQKKKAEAYQAAVPPPTPASTSKDAKYEKISETTTIP